MSSSRRTRRPRRRHHREGHRDGALGQHMPSQRTATMHSLTRTFDSDTGTHVRQQAECIVVMIQMGL